MHEKLTSESGHTNFAPIANPAPTPNVPKGPGSIYIYIYIYKYILGYITV